MTSQQQTTTSSADEEMNRLARDQFNLVKIILAYTEGRRLFALHTLSKYRRISITRTNSKEKENFSSYGVSSGYRDQKMPIFAIKEAEKIIRFMEIFDIIEVRVIEVRVKEVRVTETLP